MEAVKRQTSNISMRSRGSSVNALCELRETINVRQVSKQSRDSLLSESDKAYGGEGERGLSMDSSKMEFRSHSVTRQTSVLKRLNKKLKNIREASEGRKTLSQMSSSLIMPKGGGVFGSIEDERRSQGENDQDKSSPRLMTL